MKFIAELKDGAKLVELTGEEVKALVVLGEVIADLSDMSRILTIGGQSVPASRRAMSPAVRAARQRFNLQRVQASEKHLAPSRLKAKQKADARRNKKCPTCHSAFFDDSRTATRKWCGPHGCRNGEAGEVRSSDLPKDGNGRTIPLVPEG